MSLVVAMTNFVIAGSLLRSILRFFGFLSITGIIEKHRMIIADMVIELLNIIE